LHGGRPCAGIVLISPRTPARALLDGPTGPRVLGLGRLDQMKHVLSAAVVPPTEPEVDDRRR